MKLTKKTKANIRKAIKITYAISAILAVLAVWNPIWVYVATRNAVNSMIALAASLLVIAFACFMSKLREICK
jgi:heme/copper-type cytochrome/quinol oxidase subunit 4